MAAPYVVLPREARTLDLGTFATNEELERIAEAHGMTVLGPVPDTYLKERER